MNRRSIQLFCGLMLAVACQGGGSPNDFGLGPSDNAPTDPGAPPDPNAPPGNQNDPPFSDGRVPGTSVNCATICNEIVSQCPDEEPNADDCVQECTTEIPAQCRDLAIAWARCVARNGCDFDVEPGNDQVIPCEAELVAYVGCLGPDPDPGGGEGGARQ